MWAKERRGRNRPPDVQTEAVPPPDALSPRFRRSPRPPAVPRGRATPAASPSPRTFVPPIPSADSIARGVGGAGWAVGGAPRGAEGAEVENRPPAAPFKMGGLGGQVSVPAA